MQIIFLIYFFNNNFLNHGHTHFKNALRIKLFWYVQLYLGHEDKLKCGNTFKYDVTSFYIMTSIHFKSKWK